MPADNNVEVPCTVLADEELAAVSAGEFNGFVNFGDIKGESMDDKHKDWIEISSFAYTHK